jgi:methyl-accepting chemotaxis protein
MKLKNLRITWKLALLTAIPLAGLGVFAGVAFNTVANLRVGGPVYQRVVMGKDLVADILPPPAYILETYLVVLQMEGETNPEAIRSLAQRCKKLHEDYDTRIAVWTRDLPEGSMKTELLQESQTHAQAFFKQLDEEFVPALLADERDQASDLARGPMRESYENHRASIDKVVNYATTFSADAEAYSAASFKERSLFLWSVLGVGVVGSGLLGFWLSRSVNKPMHEMLTTIDDIASGKRDLTSRVDETRKDEIGQLAAGVNRFVSKLQNLLQSTAQASTDVTTSSGAIQDLAASMADHMDQQADKVRQIASAMTEMSASASEVAQQASEAAKAANESGTVAEQGGKTVSTSIEGMQSIRGAVQKSTKAVNTLGERSQAIGQMIAIINDIADQTNLLALNAAIEAARAGEHGRGFAVVADEVRKLADRTTKATDEIAQSIRQIQEETNAAVASMDEGAKQVEVGAELTARAGSDLERIVKSAGSVNSMVNAIATAAQEQSSTTEHVSRALDDISTATNQTRQSAQEALTAIQSLAERANGLKRAIDECGLRITASDPATSTPSKSAKNTKGKMGKAKVEA